MSKLTEAATEIAEGRNILDAQDARWYVTEGADFHNLNDREQDEVVALIVAAL